MADVRLTGVTKSFGTTEVLKGVDLEIADGEFVVFVGPSGCGKSTLLRTIAGLEEATGGDIAIGGRIVNDLGPSDRGIAMVFQSYALYPHMSVYENMAFGLKLAKADKAEIDRRVRGAAETLNITDYLDRKPKALSGGQRQRVAIGRAIVREPQVFLFDEPLSNLDAALRVRMRYEFASLHERLKTTMVYVTHDQIEAMTMADHVVVMRQGVIEQQGPPLELYDRPVNKFVAGFIGSPAMNFIPAKVGADGRSLVFELGNPQFVTLDRPLPTASKLIVGLRPEHLRLVQEADAQIRLPVGVVESTGSMTYITSATTPEINVVVTDRQPLRSGEMMSLGFDPAHLHLFDTDSERRIDIAG